MKKILLLFAITAASRTGFAQIRAAIVAGGHQASVNETNNLPGWDTLKGNYQPRTGAHFGFIADLPFSEKSKVFFQPGVIFHNKGRKFSALFDTTISPVLNQTKTEYLNYVDIPLNLVLKFGKKTKFMIGGGPYLSFFFNGKQTSNTFFKNGDFEAVNNEDLPIGNKPDKYDIIDYGVNALAGVEFGRVFLTANYSRGLNDFFQTTSYDGSFKHQVIGGTLGIFLGKPVALIVKVKDKDKDGVPDAEDACPAEAGTTLTKGCPDKDGDGVADKDDKCPDIAGLTSKNGCPVVDKDNDGVDDDFDKCPGVTGLKKYDGCPVPDTDKDGLNDDEDKCPSAAGVTRYYGCPVPDSDKDGVDDESDKCPDMPGIAANSGCPEIKKEIIERVTYAAKRIQFQVNKTLLLPASFKVLDEVAKILTETPDLKLGIEGHTSREGKYETNMKLSQGRADAVKNYLVSKGIDPSRLIATGFGPDKPLVEEKTAKDRAVNRRVELNLHY